MDCNNNNYNPLLHLYYYLLSSFGGFWKLVSLNHSVVDPDPEWGLLFRPWDKGEPSFQKNFFQPFRPLFGLKHKGGRAGPPRPYPWICHCHFSKFIVVVCDIWVNALREKFFWYGAVILSFTRKVFAKINSLAKNTFCWQY